MSDYISQADSDGILNAFVLYFRLHCDEDPANDFSSGCAEAFSAGHRVPRPAPPAASPRQA